MFEMVSDIMKHPVCSLQIINAFNLYKPEIFCLVKSEWKSFW